MSAICACEPQGGLGGGGGSARGGNAPPPTAGDPAESGGNAADVYIEVYDTLGKPLMDSIANGQNVDAKLAEHAGDIERMVVASGWKRCDFGVNWSEGLNAMMPHVGKMRRVARILKADATRLLAAGDKDGAAKRIAALLRISDQLTREGKASIELLVATAIAAMASEFVVSNPSLAEAAWKTDIQQAIAEVQGDGLLNSAAVIKSDFEIAARSLREGTVPDTSEMGGWNWATVSQSERDALADKLDAIKEEAVKAWSGPGAAGALAGLGQRAKDEGIGEFVTSLDKLRTSMDRLRGDLDKAGAVLAKQ
ncbi:MAG: hypothetical protein IT435_01170 [Phycisphaerales bacterium]|nr:hypothetical protein [Phycisphaerales bacterium]